MTTPFAFDYEDAARTGLTIAQRRGYPVPPELDELAEVRAKLEALTSPAAQPGGPATPTSAAAVEEALDAAAMQVVLGDQRRAIASEWLRSMDHQVSRVVSPLYPSWIERVGADFDTAATSLRRSAAVLPAFAQVDPAQLDTKLFTAYSEAIHAVRDLEELIGDRWTFRTITRERGGRTTHNRHLRLNDGRLPLYVELALPALSVTRTIDPNQVREKAASVKTTGDLWRGHVEHLEVALGLTAPGPMLTQLGQATRENGRKVTPAQKWTMLVEAEAAGWLSLSLAGPAGYEQRATRTDAFASFGEALSYAGGLDVWLDKVSTLTASPAA